MSEKDLPMEVEESGDLDSTDSSSDEENSKEQELLEKVKELENILLENKYLYDTHVELIKIYKTLGDINSLRAAFKRFYEYFPLTPSLWLEWINTEKLISTTSEEIENIFKLFDQAVDDYLSIEVWTEYAQFAIGASNIERTRTILERGVNAAGLVCDKGSLIWDVYREIETVHISLYTENTEEWRKQVLKVADIFKRELSVPLLGMENTYDEWANWCKLLPEGMVDSKPVEYGYKSAFKTIKIYKPFEEQLLVSKSSDEIFKTYKEYIKAVSDPSTIICLFERAALQLCLVPDFWIEYCHYVFKLGEAAITVCGKAIRNCPWSEDLWVFKLRVLEKLKKQDSLVMECFEQGIVSISPNPGLELWLAYIEYTHRCVGSPEKLDKLFNQAIQTLGFESDPQSKISRLFSRILSHRGDIAIARKIWEQILSSPDNKGSSALWVEYANLERQYGDPHCLRSLFKKALKAIKDWPQYIIEEWLMYERHFGTLDDVINCIQKCREIHPTLNQSYQYSEQTNQQKVQEKFSAQPHKQRAEFGKGMKRKYNQEHDSQNEKKKIKEDKEKFNKNSTNIKAPIDKNPETTVFLSNLHPSVDEEILKRLFPNAVNLDIVLDRKGKSRCFGYVQFKTQEEVMVALARDREPLDGRPLFISEIKSEKTEKKPVFKYANNEEKNKLFVKGLPVKKTKEEIEDIFRKYGAKDVRLVLHKSGQPKGLAYVEFENEEQSKKALKETDQMSVDDHVITVAISAPPPKQRGPQKGLFGNTFDQRGDPIRHARSRLQTSLLPRSLQMKISETKKDEPTNASEKEKKNMKSNSDFRALLLKK